MMMRGEWGVLEVMFWKGGINEEREKKDIIMMLHIK